MNDARAEKWYFKTSIVVIALLSVGPLALPLLWWNPRYKRLTKIIWTLLVLVLTYALGKMLEVSVRSLYQYYQQVFGSL